MGRGMGFAPLAGLVLTVLLTLLLALLALWGCVEVAAQIAGAAARLVSVVAA